MLLDFSEADKDAVNSVKMQKLEIFSQNSTDSDIMVINPEKCAVSAEAKEDGNSVYIFYAIFIKWILFYKSYTMFYIIVIKIYLFLKHIFYIYFLIWKLSLSKFTLHYSAKKNVSKKCIKISADFVNFFYWGKYCNLIK